MIIKFKIFENDNYPVTSRNLRVGDYIILDRYWVDNDELNDFISSNVGKIIKIRDKDWYMIEYVNTNMSNRIKEFFVNNTRNFLLPEIKRFATPEEIEKFETIKNLTKYNL